MRRHPPSYLLVFLLEKFLRFNLSIEDKQQTLHYVTTKVLNIFQKLLWLLIFFGTSRCLLQEKFPTYTPGGQRMFDTRKAGGVILVGKCENIWLVSGALGCSVAKRLLFRKRGILSFEFALIRFVSVFRESVLRVKEVLLGRK